MDNIVIETPRAALKFPLPYVSAETVAEAIGDPETVRYMSAVPSMDYTLEDAEGFLGFLRCTAASDADLELGVFLKPGDTFAGMCTLENIDRASGTCELGYWLCKTYVGRGYMSECAATLLRYAKNELHMRSVNAFVNTEHKRSIALLERLGFTRRKRLENDTENKGVLVDRYWYELTF